jgi:GTP-binding protein
MGKRLKLLYATQRREDEPRRVPVPEYLLFVNYAELMTRTYERFLENQIRSEYPMEGLPFVFAVKSRVSETKEARNKVAKAKSVASGENKPSRGKALSAPATKKAATKKAAAKSAVKSRRPATKGRPSTRTTTKRGSAPAGKRRPGK